MCLLQEKGEVWRPQYIEVMAWPYDYAPEESVFWPKDWPDLNSPYTVKRHEDSYSIYLEYDLLDDLVILLRSEKPKGAVVMNGKKFAVDYRLVFEGEPYWRKAFSGERQRNRAPTGTRPAFAQILPPSFPHPRSSVALLFDAQVDPARNSRFS
ncbi:MAG: hypothetical protein JXD23_13445 [Spirochaetales bacterium]|nr:hypothetical protein [Spirochaetales bacterium]